MDTRTWTSSTRSAAKQECSRVCRYQIVNNCGMTMRMTWSARRPLKRLDLPYQTARMMIHLRFLKVLQVNPRLPLVGPLHGAGREVEVQNETNTLATGDLGRRIGHEVPVLLRRSAQD